MMGAARKISPGTPDARYFAARPREERAAACEAGCEELRAIHFELARCYWELSLGFGGRRVDAYEARHLLPLWQ